MMFYLILVKSFVRFLYLGEHSAVERIQKDGSELSVPYQPHSQSVAESGIGMVTWLAALFYTRSRQYALFR